MKECTVYTSVVITKGGRGWAFVTVYLFRAPPLQSVLKPDPFSVQFKLGPWKLKPTRQNFHSTALDFCTSSQDYYTQVVQTTPSLYAQASFSFQHDWARQAARAGIAKCTWYI